MGMVVMFQNQMASFDLMQNIVLGRNLLKNEFSLIVDHVKRRKVRILRMYLLIGIFKNISHTKTFFVE